MPGVTFARTPPEPYPRPAETVAFRHVMAGSGRNTALPVHSHDDEADGDARGSGSAREHSDHDGAQPDHHPGGNDGRGAAPCTGSEPPASGAHQKRPGGLDNTAAVNPSASLRLPMTQNSTMPTMSASAASALFRRIGHHVVIQWHDVGFVASGE